MKATRRARRRWARLSRLDELRLFSITTVRRRANPVADSRSKILPAGRPSLIPDSLATAVTEGGGVTMPMIERAALRKSTRPAVKPGLGLLARDLARMRDHKMCEACGVNHSAVLKGNPGYKSALCLTCAYGRKKPRPATLAERVEQGTTRASSTVRGSDHTGGDQGWSDSLHPPKPAIRPGVSRRGAGHDRTAIHRGRHGHRLVDSLGERCSGGAGDRSPSGTVFHPMWRVAKEKPGSTP